MRLTGKQKKGTNRQWWLPFINMHMVWEWGGDGGFSSSYHREMVGSTVDNLPVCYY